MPKEITKEETVALAIKEYQDAMLENIKASRAETEIVIKRRKAHYRLIKAKEVLSGVELDMLQF